MLKTAAGLGTANAELQVKYDSFQLFDWILDIF